MLHCNYYIDGSEMKSFRGLATIVLRMAFASQPLNKSRLQKVTLAIQQVTHFFQRCIQNAGYGIIERKYIGPAPIGIIKK